MSHNTRQKQYPLRSRANIPQNIQVIPEDRVLPEMAMLNAQDPLYQALTNGLVNINDAMADIQNGQAAANQTVEGLNGQMDHLHNFTVQTNNTLARLQGDIHQQRRTNSQLLLPKPFGGSISENPTKFLRSVNQYAVYMGLDNPAKCHLMPMILTSRAKNWYDSLLPDTQNDWDALQTQLEAKYGAAAVGLLRKNQLLNRQQGEGESIEAYTTDLIARLDMTAAPEPEKLEIYIRGLSPYYRAYVLDRGAQTIEQAETQALKAESLRVLQRDEIIRTTLDIQSRLAQTQKANETPHIPSTTYPNTGTRPKQTQDSDQIQYLQHTVQALETQVSKMASSNQTALSRQNQDSVTTSEIRELKDSIKAMESRLRDLQLQPPSQGPTNTHPSNSGPKRPVECFNCGANHFVKDCPQNRRQQASRAQNSDPICFKCGGRHYTNACMVPIIPPVPTCSFCGIKGHKYHECRKRLNQNQGQWYQGRGQPRRTPNQGNY